MSPTPERCLPTWRRGLLALGLLALANGVHALPTDRDQPVKVAADAASFDQKTGVAVYKGHVHIQQGTLEVSGDEVTLTVDKNGSVQDTLAIGKPAHYQQKTDEKKGVVTADASRIDYDVANQKMTLTGAARLHQDTSSFKGESIIYLIEAQQVNATGGVTLEFPPQARDSVGKDKTK